ncbi:DUF2637 domain-containing protein [Streptomyces antnestii]|uniref:DUF2637 domain-containing protein n=1 Tax=Streptomyces antnestii TaxID=2494256 RepID=A0A437PY56_9ACTN|nr:DUF2637 domain-containing protein [Streptomyces sp. San01]RVU27192.1 DUF2637 domain-containing protein [Streptomyces sp. San01]
MTKAKAERTAILVAGAVITALTIAAFWLSYAHLASVAQAHGLAGSPQRRWAWPGTIDLFILAGEVLMFRAALRHVTDWWAIGLTVAGSLGSIGLNVAGVGDHAPFLDYVVAAVPPSAALLAFGALMRQVHTLVTDPEPEPVAVPEPVTVERAPEPPPAELPTAEPAPVPEPAPELTAPEPLPAPALSAPAVPPALLDHAQKIADTHKASTGNPIAPDVLRTRLGLPAPMADAIAAQLQLA